MRRRCLGLNRPLQETVQASLVKRRTLLQQLHAEGTTSYRLFHGAGEGCPGATLDRYGDLLIWQTWRDGAATAPAAAKMVQEECRQLLNLTLPFHWHDRRRSQARGSHALASGAQREHTAHEMGLKFYIEAPCSRSGDPWLYLDSRVVRRWLRTHARDCEVLNMYAYTCSAGIAAIAAGARRVVNVDLCPHVLNVGQRNAAANGLATASFETVNVDALQALRAFAGMLTSPLSPAAGTAPLSRRQFDIVFLDPPLGQFRPPLKYEDIFRPSVLATRPGGIILATNHDPNPEVKMDDWLAMLRRCAKDAGRPLADLRVLTPEDDFPSPDGKYQFRMAVAVVG